MDARTEDLIRAAEAVKRLAQQQKDLVLAGDILTAIGSFQQSADEAEARAVKANAEAAAAVAKLAELNAGLGAAIESSAAIVSAAESQRGAILAAADAEATRIVSNADKQVAGIIEKAGREAQELIDAAMSRKADIDAIVDTRAEESGRIQAETEAKTLELAALNDKIDRARETMKAMLG